MFCFYWFRVKKEEIAQLASVLLSSLFSALCLPGSTENEYVMKGMLLLSLFSEGNVLFVNYKLKIYFCPIAIMRSFSSLQEHVIPFLAELLPKLTEKLALVARNPSKPHFNHYLFETIGLSIRYLAILQNSSKLHFDFCIF